MIIERKNYADIYKGIAVFMVIMGHSTLCNNYLKQVIYTFHMPAFFLIYGLVYSVDKHRDRGYISWKFVLNKAMRLLVPCFIWGLIYMVINRNVSLKGLLFLLYGNQIGFNNAGSLSSLWFLPCMFLAVVGFEYLIKLIDRKKYQSVMMIGFAFLFILISYFLPKIRYGYPLSIDVAFLALAFILIGFLFRTIMDKTPQLREPRFIILGGVFSAIILLATFKINLSYININNADMASRNYGNMVLYLLDALSGSYLLFAVSIMLSHLQHKKLLCFMGRNTMQIFILHKPIVILLSNALEKTVLYSSIGGIAASLATLGICIALTAVTNRFVPFMFGISFSNAN